MGASPSALQPSWLHARGTVAADSARGDLAPSNHMADDAWALGLAAWEEDIAFVGDPGRCLPAPPAARPMPPSAAAAARFRARRGIPPRLTSTMYRSPR
ncbi:hypothetical protein GQ55_7G126200 [Panicum hallii var. hallii]|uniref:Uncharacterized protein n=1 Tax=Panicum hallii var. hallii TaxID=1504633 RepID=A0A2T7CUJ9_9POAL|nr:hypothetical protein GQ55_7G126200 [Panicum hallii var. hallii]